MLQLKYIIRLILFPLLVGIVVSCQSWHEARAVVKEADSLLVEHKVVTRDTTALLFAINTLDGPLGHVFERHTISWAGTSTISMTSLLLQTIISCATE